MIIDVKWNFVYFIFYILIFFYYEICFGYIEGLFCVKYKLIGRFFFRGRILDIF